MSAVAPVAVLELTKGSAQSFRIAVRDENGNPESLSGADKASLTIAEKAGGTVVFQADTVLGNLSIDVATGELVVTPTQGQADAFVRGSFIAASAVHYTAGGGRWIDSDPFVTRIRPSIAAHL